MLECNQVKRLNTFFHPVPNLFFILIIHVQDKQVLEVRQYSATCWPNPDSPIRNCFDLVNRVGGRSRLSDTPTIVHDP